MNNVMNKRINLRPLSSISLPTLVAALSAMPLLLVTPVAKALTVVANGAVLDIDSLTVIDNYRVTGAGSTLNATGANMSDVQVQTGGAFNMQGGSVRVTSGTGVDVTNSSATVNNATISGGSTGLSAARLDPPGVIGSGSQVQVTGSTIQASALGVVVTSRSQMQLSATQVTASAATGIGAAVTGGDLFATNGTSITGGNQGILIRSDTLDVPGTNRVVLDNSSATGTAGAAIQVGGGSAITADIQVLNGSTLSGGNGNLLEVTDNATANLLVGSSALNGNVQVAQGSTANLSFNQGQMTGDFNVADGGTGTLNMQNGSQFTGNLINVDGVTIGGGSTWNMVASNSVGSLAMNGGSVKFGAANEFFQLNVGTLAGNGTFAMDVDWQTNQHDTLNVTGVASGSHSLLVAGSGVDPASPEQLTLVHTAGGDATFALAGAGVVDVGTFSYALGSAANGSGGTDWFLDPSSKTISPGTESVLALFNTAPTVWYGELTTLRSRMGELRFNGGQAGGWVRTYGNKYVVNAASGLGYKQTQQGFSLGADAPLPFGDGQWLVGVLAGHSDSDLSLSRGSSGTVKSYYAGLYTTWLNQDTGYYFDGVLKLNRFDNHSKVSISDGTRAKGDYKNSGIGGSVEFGRHIKLDDGYFVEPYGQLSTVVIRGKNYELDNDLQAEGDRTRSLLGKVGVTGGRNFTLDSGTVVQPYLRVAAAHEFAKNNEVQVNNNVFNNDLSGSRGELGAGVAVAFSERLQLHADFDYSNGRNIEQPFGANVGLRYSW